MRDRLPHGKAAAAGRLLAAPSRVPAEPGLPPRLAPPLALPARTTPQAGVPARLARSVVARLAGGGLAVPHRHPPLLEALARCGVPHRVLLAALHEARAVGAGFEDALYAGPLTEDAAATLLARRFGFGRAGPSARAAPGTRIEEAVRLGAVRLEDGRIAALPRAATLERLGRSVPPGRLALTSRGHLVALALAADRTRVAAMAAGALARRRPDLAAVTGPTPWQRALGLVVAFGLAFSVAAGLAGWGPLLQGLACVLFLALAWARLAAWASSPEPAITPVFAL